MKRRIVCFDFDGVLHDYSAGWQGVAPTGAPIPGAVDQVKWALAQGYDVVVHSCRANYQDGPEEMEKWLHKHGFPISQMRIAVGEKPHAHWYIDDRAVRFEGDWDQVREEMKKEPWYR